MSTNFGPLVLTNLGPPSGDGCRSGPRPGTTNRRLAERSALRLVPFALCGSAPEPIGIGASRDDVRTVCETIYQGLAQPWVRDNLGPLRERQVRGHDHRGLLGSVSDHLEHQLASCLGERHIA